MTDYHMTTWHKWTAVLFAFSTVSLASPAAHADTWPSRPITIIVGYPPGGGADIMARLVSQKMGLVLGQSILIENRPGSAAQIAAYAVARSAPDGYTVLVDASAFAINLGMYPKLPYKRSSFETVGVIATLPLLMVVNPKFPTRSVAELIAQAKAKPGDIFFATSGNGSLMNIAGALFEEKAGVKLTAVPYKGAGAALNDLVGGQVPLYFGNAAATLPFVKSGTLRPLAVTGQSRAAELPNVPTLSEAKVDGMELYEWNAMFAPAGTPAGVVNKLSGALRDALATPQVADRIKSLAAVPFTGGRAESQKFVDGEIARLGKVIEERHITPD
jgi:tripartite-type tricarboxylate transporter receptor subunit TctC